MKPIPATFLIACLVLSANMLPFRAISLQTESSSCSSVGDKTAVRPNCHPAQVRNYPSSDMIEPYTPHPLDRSESESQDDLPGFIVDTSPEPSSQIREIAPLYSDQKATMGPLSSAVTWLQFQVPYHQQDMSNWCWAASLAMQHQWWSPTTLGTGYQQQSEIVQYIKGSVVNQGANADEIHRVVREWNLINPAYFSFRTTYKGPGNLFSLNPPTGFTDDPKTWIDYVASPVIAFVDTDVPTDGVANHAVLIVGYDDTLNGGSVFIHDPWFTNWWPGHSTESNYELTLTYAEFNARWNTRYEGIWPFDKYHGMVAGIPGDQQYTDSMVALNYLPSEVDLGQTYELQLALTEDGSDAGSSRQFWAQGVFLRLSGAELVSASSGGFDSYQSYDEWGNSVPITGATIIEFYSDFTLRSATIYAYATIRTTGNVIARYRGWITDEDDMTHCVVHTQVIDDDRPSSLTMFNAELAIKRDPADFQNDRSNFLDYPTSERSATLRGLAPTTISVSVSPSQINLGGGTSISGAISSPTPGDLSGTVFVQYSTNNVNWYDISTTASSYSGAYSYWWVPPSTGTFYIHSYWNGNAHYAGATSSSATLNVVSGSGNLGDHTMCKNVQSTDPYDPIVRTNTFFTDDYAAVSWLHFNGPIYGSHTVHWDWIDPDGSNWLDDDYIIPDSTDYGYDYWPGYRTWLGVYIDGYQAWYATRLGRSFQTKVYYDGSLVVTETWQVVKHGSSITVSVSSTSITYGQSVTVSSQISPSLSDGTTTIQYSVDGTSWNNIASGTPSNGYYSTVWAPPTAANYYIRATWNGNLDYYGSTSSVQSVTVDRATTSLALDLSSSAITYGSSVTITAAMSPSLSGKMITIQFSLDGLTWYYLSSGTTSSAGQYAFTWASDAGIYYIRSTWSGDANYYGATSPSRQLTVNKASTSISCSLSSTVIDWGESVSINVVISVPVSDGTVSLEYAAYQLPWTLISSGTPTSGSYSYQWTPPLNRTLSVRAVWSGNTNYLGSTGGSSESLDVVGIVYVPSNYLSIQDAVIATSTYNSPFGANYTIYVCAGTYNGNVELYSNHNLRILGESNTGTIVNGSVSLGYTYGGTVENLHVLSGIELNNGAIRNNIIEGGLYLWGAHYFPSSENIIENNTLIGGISSWMPWAYGVAIELSATYSNRIIGNTITAAEVGICDHCTTDPYTPSSSDNTIEGNYITNCSIGIQVVADYYEEWERAISRSRVLNNTFENNEYGVYLDHVTNVTISGNTIRNSTRGIDLERVAYMEISDNMLFSNDIGILLLNSSIDNVIVGNNITNQLFDGILIDDLSNANTISHNNIANNGFRGISFWGDSRYNVIFGNNITNNGIGILIITPPASNTIYNNNFIGNSQQVYIDIPEYVEAVWDGGYLAGGNYWSDYLGMDLYWGLYQNKTGSDGIGDTPYVIDGSNRDNYPLMSPYEYWSNPILGDINRDMEVDSEDLSQVTTAYGSSTQSSDWNPNSDIDNNGKVDVLDLFNLGRNYGETVQTIGATAVEDVSPSTTLSTFTVLSMVGVFVRKGKTPKKLKK